MKVSDPGGGDFEKAPEGTHVARCYRFIDLGTQFNEKWNTHQRKVQISWELPTELMEDGRPFMVSAQYTASLSEKAYLRRDLESWRGRKFTDEERAGFELDTVLGAPCMLNVVHNTTDGTTYTNVQGIVAMPKGMECPELVNKIEKFNIEDPDMELFDTFTDKMKEKIKKAPEWRAGEGEESPPPEYDGPPPDEYNDSIPF